MDTSKEITKACDDRVDELLEIALEATGRFWDMRNAGNKNKKLIRKSNLGCRAVKTKTQFRIGWYYNTYNRQGGGKVDPYSKHIDKDAKRHRYLEKNIRKHATRWEWEYVLEAENVFALIREELDALHKIRRSLLVQKRVSAKLHVLLEEDYEID